MSLWYYVLSTFECMLDAQMVMLLLCFLYMCMVMFNCLVCLNVSVGLIHGLMNGYFVTLLMHASRTKLTWLNGYVKYQELF